MRQRWRRAITRSIRWGALSVGATLGVATLPALAVGPARPQPPRELVLRVEPTSVSSEAERVRLEEELEKVTLLLPQKVRDTLNRPVTVRFDALDAAPGVYVPPCRGGETRADWEPQILGRVSKSIWRSRRDLTELSIHQGFKAELLAGESSARTYECGHRNLYRLALATLIHEIGHLYDYADPRTPEEEEAFRECNRHSAAPGSSLCSELLARHTISTQKSFLDLTGWVETGVVFRSRKQGNQSQVRSPDPYEFKNPRESFSVNLEYFVLDPEFACRRPALHRYLKNHFNEDLHPSRSCQVQTTLPLTSGIVGGPSLVTDLDPSRIYQVHSLFAGKGPATMSRWGHSLFRIVRCAPEREKVGPECIHDIAHHVAVSFRANVPDAAISYLKGLWGGYSSLLFAQPFLSVVEEYNKGEFRELVSLPLQLSEDQKTLFIERVLEASWEYAGRYRFISNNCATEALNFLKGVLGEGTLHSYHPTTPMGLHEVLQKTGLVDPSPLADLGRASESGNYFASKKPEVDSAFAGVMEAFSSVCGKDCIKKLPKSSNDYLDQTLAGDRREWYELLVSSGMPGTISRRVLGARFFLLESYVIRRSEHHLLKRIAAVLEGGKKEGLSALNPDDKKSLEHIRGLMERLRALQQQKLPLLIKNSGYGIPTALSSEGDTDSPPRSGSDLATEEKTLASEVLTWARSAFESEFAEIEASTKNRLFFLKEMRTPAAPPARDGGLQ